MYTCGICSANACKTGDIDNAPKNCPCRDEIMEESKAEYKKS